MFIPYCIKPKYQHHLRGGKCWYCKEQFQKRDRVIGLTFLYRGKTIMANYHWECLKKLIDEWFKINPFKEERRKRKGKAYPELLRMRRRLVSLLYYHKKHNNTERVEELEKEIEKITV
jgi:hypothetical protein